MFNLQGSEIIVILLVALVVLGPEKLPDAVRRASRTYHEFKKMGAGFQSELKAALDEPMREMRETADLVRDAADPRKLTADTPPPAAGEVGATSATSHPSAPAVEGDGAAEGTGDDDEVLGEMWEDEALYPGSSTVGTPPRRPDDPASDAVSDPAGVPASDAVSDPAGVPASDPASDPVSDPAGVPASDPASDAVSEPAGVPASDSASDPVSEPESDATDDDAQ